MHVWLLLFLSAIAAVSGKCPDHQFLGCMLRLKAQRAPIEKNILSLVFNIGTEARLLHTCKVYSGTLPCFRDKVDECGDDKQRRLLNEVSKMLMFICSPFSLTRQRALITYQQCISSVLALPATTACALEEHDHGRQVIKCKSECSDRGSDFICMMRTWISEQNTCTLRDIKLKCGEQAANLYYEMQTTVFEPQFPIICSYDKSDKPISTTTPSLPEFGPANNTIMEYKHVFMKPVKAVKNITDFEPVSVAPTKPKRVWAKPTAATLPATSIQQRPVALFPAAPVVPSMVYVPEIDITPEMTPFPIFTMNNMSQVWTKRPNSQKVEYNKEFWKQKGPDYHFTTQHPLFATTLTGVTPKSHKVIDILKSFLPPNLPYKLTSLFESSLNKQTYSPDLLNFNTPVVEFQPSDFTSPVQQVSYVTASPTAVRTTQQLNFYPEKLLTTKWKPWYLRGAPES